VHGVRDPYCGVEGYDEVIDFGDDFASLVGIFELWVPAEELNEFNQFTRRRQRTSTTALAGDC